jgi:hypothetical protein
LHVTEAATAGPNPVVTANAVEYAAVGTIAPGGGRSDVVAFGAYIPVPVANPAIAGSGPTAVGFITANPLEAAGDFQGLEVTQPMIAPGGAMDYLTKNAGYFINAGNGGNSQSGAGGAGGSFGQSLTVSSEATVDGVTTVGTGTLSFEFPTDTTFQGVFNIVAGQGGNGFTNGGAGGSLTGLSLTYGTAPVYSGTALLFAGTGGQSLTGTGVAGGSEGQLFVVSGEVFVAGDGGIGVIGGAGGNLLGNTQQGLVTAQTNNVNPIIILKAGDGATGITGGGNGGNINSFVNQFNAFIGGVGGLLNYVAGNAGNAVAGQGGEGGSVLNSSPATVENNLVGDIYLQGGLGGSGMLGGFGGSVVDFANVTTVKDIPTTTTFIAGAGGNATLGTGGKGGGVSEISASSSGNGFLYTFDFANPSLLTSPLGALTSETPISYNRMVAGQGGNSVGGTGGAGGTIGGAVGFSGSLANIITASVAANSANVLAGGAGGNGLTAGGAGGGVLNTDVNSAFKVLVIGGDGGSSSSVKPADLTNPMDVALAIGGINGPGGAGGSITNFVQLGSTQTNVDLIAGNGGATLNHSFAAGNSLVDNSGVGGSIDNIAVTGNIGNSNATVAIKSYNNIFIGQTMQQFVDSYILGNPAGVLTDAVGNVGLVAGAGGLVEGVNPATGVAAPGTLNPSSNAISGSVNNVFAENIMSMVAGNVDQVSLIQSLTDYGVTTSGGILGAAKTVSDLPFSGTLSTTAPNYISTSGTIVDTPLPGGGALLDGAFLAKNIRIIKSIRDFQGTVA